MIECKEGERREGKERAVADRVVLIVPQTYLFDKHWLLYFFSVSFSDLRV